jgi:hypothetical protein
VNDTKKVPLIQVDEQADNVGLFILANENPNLRHYKAVSFAAMEPRIRTAVNSGDYERLRFLLVRTKIEPPRFYPVSLLLNPAEFLPYFAVDALEIISQALEN